MWQLFVTTMLHLPRIFIFFILVVPFYQVFNATQDSKIEKELGCGKVIDVPLGLPHENAHIITQIPLI